MGNDESRYGRGAVIKTLPTLVYRQAQTGTIPGCAAHWGAAAIQMESGVKHHSFGRAQDRLYGHAKWTYGTV